MTGACGEPVAVVRGETAVEGRCKCGMSKEGPDCTGAAVAEVRGKAAVECLWSGGKGCCEAAMGDASLGLLGRSVVGCLWSGGKGCCEVVGVGEAPLGLLGESVAVL